VGTRSPAAKYPLPESAGLRRVAAADRRFPRFGSVLFHPGRKPV